MVQSAAPITHGGDLGAARKLFPAAPEPLVDLSTGINPFSYPLPPLDPALFARLPEPGAVDRLAAVAAAAFGAPSAAHVVAAPGVQILLPMVAALMRPGRAAVLGRTYEEHARAAALAGHGVRGVAQLSDLGGADLAVVVNPNNPDGRLLARDALRDLADALAPGLLVVDEAFIDATPQESIAPDVTRPNLVVLRSFGKFFGLAGLRLGFALAPPALAVRLAAALGPWAVSGPALAIGAAALADADWMAATRARLAVAAQRLDTVLAASALEIVGGTVLFRLVRTAAAATLFERLGRAGIVVRRFADQPTWLRFGLPGEEPAWQRLAAALQGAQAR
ncbi:MAG TPA: threonine-phosphate decarboxylase CobD [Xanthobacteraceae bacterium]|nr:threonine-phosphate decarboxylase CobD [Xanthobacteraceae bacterium]